MSTREHFIQAFKDEVPEIRPRPQERSRPPRRATGRTRGRCRPRTSCRCSRTSSTTPSSSSTRARWHSCQNPAPADVSVSSGLREERGGGEAPPREGEGRGVEEEGRGSSWTARSPGRLRSATCSGASCSTRSTTAASSRRTSGPWARRSRPIYGPSGGRSRNVTCVADTETRSARLARMKNSLRAAAPAAPPRRICRRAALRRGRASGRRVEGARRLSPEPGRPDGHPRPEQGEVGRPLLLPEGLHVRLHDGSPQLPARPREVREGERRGPRREPRQRGLAQGLLREGGPELQAPRRHGRRRTKAYDSAVMHDGKTYSARNTFLIDPPGVDPEGVPEGQPLDAQRRRARRPRAAPGREVGLSARRRGRRARARGSRARSRSPA